MSQHVLEGGQVDTRETSEKEWEGEIQEKFAKVQVHPTIIKIQNTAGRLGCGEPETRSPACVIQPTFFPIINNADVICFGDSKVIDVAPDELLQFRDFRGALVGHHMTLLENGLEFG